MAEPSVTVNVMSEEDMEEIRGGGPTTDIGIILQVVAKVDWTEPWLLILMGAHLLVFSTILLWHRHTNTLACLLAVLGIVCFMSERANEWAATNWKLFSRQQYFDSSGLFISVVFSIPIVFNCIAIVVCLLLESCTMITQVAQGRARHLARRTRPQVQNSNTKKTQ